jgi:hypothetical protein
MFYLKKRSDGMGKGDKQEFSDVLERVLGFGSISREKFFEIMEMSNKKALSSQEFLKLFEIIQKQ